MQGCSEHWRKKLTTKQRKVVDSLSYEVKWTGDMLAKNGKTDIFKHPRIEHWLVYDIANKTEITKEYLKDMFSNAYRSRRQYENWDDQTNLYDVILSELDSIYKYYKKTMKGNEKK